MIRALVVAAVVGLGCSSAYHQAPNRVLATVEIYNGNFYDARVKLMRYSYPILSIFLMSNGRASKTVDANYGDVYFVVDFVGSSRPWRTESIYLVPEGIVRLEIGATEGLTYLTRRE